MEKFRRVILIDDDPIHQFLSKRIISNHFNEEDVIGFTSPREGIAFIASNHDSFHGATTMVLLDINMPVMNGWDFLDEFVELPADVRAKFVIYILSSSQIEEDKERFQRYPFLAGRLVKPLDKQAVRSLVGLGRF